MSSLVARPRRLLPPSCVLLDLIVGGFTWGWTSDLLLGGQQRLFGRQNRGAVAGSDGLRRAPRSGPPPAATRSGHYRLPRELRRWPTLPRRSPDASRPVRWRLTPSRDPPRQRVVLRSSRPLLPWPPGARRLWPIAHAPRPAWLALRSVPWFPSRSPRAIARAVLRGHTISSLGCTTLPAGTQSES